MGIATFAGVKRKLIHLYIKATNEHKYYTSLQAMFNLNPEIGVSKSKLDKYNFEKPYENLQVIVRKGEAIGTTATKTKKQP